MLRIISILILFLNPAYSHDLSSEYSELKDQISYELMANNHKKNKLGKKKKRKQKKVKKSKKIGLNINILS